ncbi:type II toxin-antitoxin system VapC family toxin [Acidobacteria bacterium AH-259-G07]|nr:type II toxin-antitoxin system VapC family toxin [Acidobacteria bacterium AH-259-G07]
MKAFFDSSGLAKRYIEEKGSDAVQEILRGASSIGLAVICIPEVISALCRHRREELISEREYGEAKDSLFEDAADAFIVNLTWEIVLRTVEILEKTALRAMDAIHIACAIRWGADLFVSSDERQLRVARNAGLKVKKV